MRLAPTSTGERRLARARAVLDLELGSALTDELMSLGTTLDRVGFNEYVVEALQRAVATARLQSE